MIKELKFWVVDKHHYKISKKAWIRIFLMYFWFDLQK